MNQAEANERCEDPQRPFKNQPSPAASAKWELTGGFVSLASSNHVKIHQPRQNPPRHNHFPSHGRDVNNWESPKERTGVGESDEHLNKVLKCGNSSNGLD